MIGASIVAGEGMPVFSDSRVVLAFGYTAVVVAFISYVAWFWLLARYSPSAMSVFTFLTPIFGAFAGVLVLGEAMTWRLLLALVLVALGIYLVNRPSVAKAA